MYSFLRSEENAVINKVSTLKPSLLCISNYFAQISKKQSNFNWKKLNLKLNLDSNLFYYPNYTQQGQF